MYDSDNGGAFVPFVTNTSATSATFTGQDGHTYSFYSVATDNLGNVQPTPRSANGIQVDGLPRRAPCRPAGVQSRQLHGVLVGYGQHGGSGIATYSVFVSDNGRAFVPLETNTMLTSITYTGRRPQLRLLQRGHRQRR